MPKKSKVLPIALFILFVLGILDIYISNLKPSPDLLKVKFLNMKMDTDVSLGEYVGNKEFSIIIFIEAGNTSVKKPLKVINELKSGGLNYSYNIIFIGVDGDFKIYRDFLINNPGVFLPYIWLYTNNTQYLTYIKDEGKPNVYLARLTGENLKLEYVGSDISVNELRNAIQKFLSNR